MATSWPHLSGLRAAGPSLSLGFFADSPPLMSLLCPSLQLAELRFITACVLLGQVMWLELEHLLGHLSPTPGVQVHCLQNTSGPPGCSSSFSSSKSSSKLIGAFETSP